MSRHLDWHERKIREMNERIPPEILAMMDLPDTPRQAMTCEESAQMLNSKWRKDREDMKHKK